jgi:hypothetical protein
MTAFRSIEAQSAVGSNANGAFFHPGALPMIKIALSDEIDDEIPL